jgi:ATP-dependent helicase/nuclease subunit A
MTADDGTLVEGVVDLSLREETAEFAGWTVVGFKTDREFQASSGSYVDQVRLYSRAVQKASG